MLRAPFCLGKFPVTQGQYMQVMGTNPSYFNGPKLPVGTVSWDDAQEFCRKVSGLLSRDREGAVVPLANARGSEFRLPTEAEWEYACRAGTVTTYYSGDTEADLARAAWYSANSKGTTHPVGQKEPNGWGLYDMHGNVWEWCQDWHGEYAAGAATDPQGPGEGAARVLRGGSWDYGAWGCRSAHRLGYIPDYRSYYFGFRVVAAPWTP